MLTVENSVLNYRRASPDAGADATFRITLPMWLRLSTGQAGVLDLVTSDEVDIDGNRLDVAAFFRLLDKPDTNFDIVVP